MWSPTDSLSMTGAQKQTLEAWMLAKISSPAGLAAVSNLSAGGKKITHCKVVVVNETFTLESTRNVSHLMGPPVNPTYGDYTKEGENLLIGLAMEGGSLGEFEGYTPELLRGDSLGRHNAHLTSARVHQR